MKPPSRKSVLTYAKTQGYNAVRYAGPWHTFHVWEPFIRCFQPHRYPRIGPPLLILTQGQTLRMSTPEEALRYMDERTTGKPVISGTVHTQEG